MLNFEPMEPLALPEDSAAKLEQHFAQRHEERWEEIRKSLKLAKRDLGRTKGWTAVVELKRNNVVEKHGRDMKERLQLDLELDWGADPVTGVTYAENDLNRAMERALAEASFSDHLIEPGQGTPPTFPFYLKLVGIGVAVATTTIAGSVVFFEKDAWRFKDAWLFVLFVLLVALCFVFTHLWSGAGPPVAEEGLKEYATGRRLARVAAFSVLAMLLPICSIDDAWVVRWSYFLLGPGLATLAYRVAEKRGVRIVERLRHHFSFRFQGTLIEASTRSRAVGRCFDRQILNIQRDFWLAGQRLQRVELTEVHVVTEGQPRLALRFVCEPLSEVADHAKDELCDAAELLEEAEAKSENFEVFEERLDKASCILDYLSKDKRDEDVMLEVPEQAHPSTLGQRLDELEIRRREAGAALQEFGAALQAKKRSTEKRDTVEMRQAKKDYVRAREPVLELKLERWAAVFLPKGESFTGQETDTEEKIEEYLELDARRKAEQWGERVGQGSGMPAYDDVEGLLHEALRIDSAERAEERTRILDATAPVFLLMLYKELSTALEPLEVDWLLEAVYILDSIRGDSIWVDEMIDAAHALAGYLATRPALCAPGSNKGLAEAEAASFLAERLSKMLSVAGDSYVHEPEKIDRRSRRSHCLAFQSWLQTVVWQARVSEQLSAGIRHRFGFSLERMRRKTECTWVQRT